jgi:hypothetical protein
VKEIPVKKTLAAVSLLLAGAAFAQLPPGENTAWRTSQCDHACLSQFARDYVTAMAKRNAASLKQAKSVRFTENDVELPFGREGMWATATAVASSGLIAADADAGQAAWLGTAEENGKPVYFALRLGVREGVLVEAETVVVRNTGLPLPFADVSKVVHDPTFNDILPPEQRRSRERLRAVADGYFNTVELNDGNVFTPFDPDCGRLENGILTTASAPSGGNAGSISPGCEAQFKLGIYQQAHPRASLSADRRGAGRGGGYRLLRPCQRVRSLQAHRRARDAHRAQVAKLDLTDRSLSHQGQQDPSHRSGVLVCAAPHAQPVLRVSAAAAPEAGRPGSPEGTLRQGLPARDG